MPSAPKKAHPLPLADALRQAHQDLEKASRHPEEDALRRALEALLAQVEDRIILSYEHGQRDGAALQALAEMLAYALEMLVEGEKDKALRTLERAIALLTPHRKEGRRHVAPPGRLPHR
ncbi:hypothetical protein HRbin23_01129 [bacterium HR23]|nr:hypothetical protein HRbin23_01129 [bacterium HR23]